MRRLITIAFISLSSLSLLATGCGDGETTDATGTEATEGAEGVDDQVSGETEANVDEASGTTEDAEAEAPNGWSELGSLSDVTPLEIPSDCGFDASLEGTGMNSHIANMKFYGLELEDGTKEKYELHLDCGGESKAVWIFLSTGWCGACNTYAKTVEKVYNAYKDQGLRVLWIVGEGDITAGGEKPPITKESFAQYVTKHAPMSFSVVRDPGFDGTYSQLDNTTPALPHQYLLDGTTMELIYKQGGTNAEGLQKVAETIGVDYAEIEALLAN